MTHAISAEAYSVQVTPERCVAWDWKKTGTRHNPGVQRRDVLSLFPENAPAQKEAGWRRSFEKSDSFLAKPTHVWPLNEKPSVDLVIISRGVDVCVLRLFSPTFCCLGRLGGASGCHCRMHCARRARRVGPENKERGEALRIGAQARLARRGALAFNMLRPGAWSVKK